MSLDASSSDVSSTSQQHTQSQGRESSPDLGNYVREKLSNAIFSGWYADRIWVDELGVYRDRIQVDDDEADFIRSVKSVHRRVKKIRSFTGIERKDEAVSIFVDWTSESQVFGHYWFLIEYVHLGRQNVDFNIRILRPVSGKDKISSQKCPHCGKLPIQNSSDVKNTNGENNQEEDPLNLSEIARTLQSKFSEVVTPSEWWTEAKPHLTFVNFVKFFKFMLILMLATVSGTANFLIYILSHTNRFVHEMSGFTRAATPFLLACVDTVNRLIAGFFTLIAMMWKDARKPAPPENPRERLAYDRQETRRAFLEGPKQSSPTRSYPYRRSDSVNKPYLKTD